MLSTQMVAAIILPKYIQGDVAKGIAYHILTWNFYLKIDFKIQTCLFT